ncbi:MAG: RcnB family protein, partial [Erythrobacter cryptus]
NEERGDRRAGQIAQGDDRRGSWGDRGRGDWNDRRGDGRGTWGDGRRDGRGTWGDGRRGDWNDGRRGDWNDGRRGGWRDGRRDDDWGRSRWRRDDWRWNWQGRPGWDRRDFRRWDRGWRYDRNYNWFDYRRGNHFLFRPGPYFPPYRSHRYSRLSIGLFLDSLFFQPRFFINDPWAYRLPPVYGPYQWVRYYDDVLLVDIYTGEVVDVIYDFFW